MTPAPSPSRASAPAATSDQLLHRGKKSQLTGTSVGHITENVSRIAYNLVRCMAFDVTDEPDTTHITVRVNKMRLLGVSRWKLGKLRLPYSQVNEREIRTE